MEKPTIQELEDILASGNDLPVEYLPSGEVRIKEDRMDHPFKYRQPDGDQARKMERMSDLFSAVYDQMIATVPANAERTLAIRKLQESRMWTNVSILGIEIQSR